MEFTGDAKQTILNLLKTGERDAALQFIAKTYYVSPDEARKLLEAFELQYVTPPPRAFDAPYQPVTASLPGNPPSPTAPSGCSGCISGVLTVLSILMLIAGLGLVAFAYFGIEFIKEEFHGQQTKSIVTGSIPDPQDSTSVLIIYKHKVMGFPVTDTTEMSYQEGMYNPGDSIATNFNLPVDPEVDETIDTIRNYLMIPGIVLIVIAVIIWFVSRGLSPARAEQQIRRIE